jgi:hypothetical protein
MAAAAAKMPFVHTTVKLEATCRFSDPIKEELLLEDDAGAGHKGVCDVGAGQKRKR